MASSTEPNAESSQCTIYDYFIQINDHFKTFYVTPAPVSIWPFEGAPMQGNVLQLVGSRIKALRIAKGLTQAQLAEITGYEPLTISRFERGAYGPSLEALYSIGKALNVDLGAFVGEMNSEDFQVQTLRHEIVDQAYACSDVKKLRIALRSLISKKSDN